jgi:hypothetical protein
LKEIIANFALQDFTLNYADERLKVVLPLDSTLPEIYTPVPSILDLHRNMGQLFVAH